MSRTLRRSLKDLLDRDVEKPVLEALYLHHGVASDQLRRQPDVLRAITSAFNRIASRDFDEETLLRYIINRRKKTDWPTLGSSAKRFGRVTDLVTDGQLEALRQVYVELDETSDELLYQPALMKRIATLFRKATGKSVEPSVLVAIIMAKRKRGLWATIRTPADAEFADIADVARAKTAG